MASLSGFNKRSGGGDGDFKSENILVRVNEYHIGGNTADPKNDYIVGKLMAPAMGLEKGAEVKVKIKERVQGKDYNSNYKPAELINFHYGVKKKIDPVVASASDGEAGVVEFQGAYLGNDGFVVSRWAKALVSNPADQLAVAFGGVYATVSSEQKSKDGSRSYQNATVALTDNARVVNNKEEFITLVTKILEKGTERGLGDPGFALRVINTTALTPDAFEADPENPEATWDKERTAASQMTRNRVKNGDNWEPEAIEETLKRFEGGKGGQLMGLIGTEGLVFEVIPMLRLNVGRSSLPSVQAEEAAQDGKNKKIVDLHDSYKRSANDKWGGYARSNVQAMKRTQGAGAGSWFLAHTRTDSFNSPVIDLRDLPTPGMPAEMFAAITTEAKSRKPDAKSEGQDNDADGAAPDPNGEAAAGQENEGQGWGF